MTWDPCVECPVCHKIDTIQVTSKKMYCKSCKTDLVSFLENDIKKRFKYVKEIHFWENITMFLTCDSKDGPDLLFEQLGDSKNSIYYIRHGWELMIPVDCYMDWLNSSKSKQMTLNFTNELKEGVEDG